MLEPKSPPLPPPDPDPDDPYPDPVGPNLDEPGPDVVPAIVPTGAEASQDAMCDNG